MWRPARLDAESPQDFGNGDEQAVLGKVHARVDASPGAESKVVPPICVQHCSVDAGPLRVGQRAGRIEIPAAVLFPALLAKVQHVLDHAHDWG